MKGSKELTSLQFLNSMSQLCHMDTSLAEWVWLQFFPKLWRILSERQQQVKVKFVDIHKARLATIRVENVNRVEKKGRK